MNEIIFIVIGVAIGFTVTYLLKKVSNKKLLSESQTEAQKIISNAKNEAENLKANKIFQAKEKFLELKSEHEKYILSKESEQNEKKQDLKNLESEIKQKSKKVDKLKSELDEKISTFTKKTESLEKKNKEIDKIKKASGSLISNTKCNSELVLIESSDPLETITEQSANYDLLILGTPEKDNWLNVLFGGGRDKFVQNSVCSVLRLTIK